MNITVDLDKLAGTLQDCVARLANLGPVMEAGEWLAVWEVKKRFETSTGPDGRSWVPLTWPRIMGATAQGGPLQNFGLLGASIVGKSDGNSITLGTNHASRNVHQFGATIRPSKGKYLTIPVTSEASRAGGARFFGRELRFEFISGLGAALVEDSTGIVQYRLLKKVTIPARPFMGWSQAWVDTFSAMLAGYITTGRI